jgi:hypothetical protein
MIDRDQYACCEVYFCVRIAFIYFLSSTPYQVQEDFRLHVGVITKPPLRPELAISPWNSRIGARISSHKSTRYLE